MDDAIIEQRAGHQRSAPRRIYERTCGERDYKAEVVAAGPPSCSSAADVAALEELWNLRGKHVSRDKVQHTHKRKITVRRRLAWANCEEGTVQRERERERERERG